MNTNQVLLDAQFLNAIVEEAKKARAKWPDSVHSVAALTEEVGELAKAILQHKYEKQDPHKVWREAVQVAFMAMRVATEGDSTFDYRPTPEQGAKTCGFAGCSHPYDRRPPCALCYE